MEIEIEYVRKLLEVAENHQDCGPPGQGWKSDDLTRLIHRVSEALAVEAIKALG